MHGAGLYTQHSEKSRLDSSYKVFKDNLFARMKIRSGSYHVLYAFDIAFEIRLSQIPILFGDLQRDSARFSFLSRGIHRETQPVTMLAEPITLEIQGRPVTFDLSFTFFDLGALSIEFMAPLETNDLQDLPRLANALHNSGALASKARELADSVSKRAHPALVNAEVARASSLFTVFNIQSHTGPVLVDDLIEQHGPQLAQVLRGSEESIGFTEERRTLSLSVTYSDQDVVFASTNAALIFDETSSDVVDIFELANAQAVELRYIDARLDRALQALYEENEKRPSLWQRMTNVFELQIQKLNTMHLDTAIILDRVDNSFKFAQDSYLSQIHELAIHKMFLKTFLQGIDRKLTSVREISSELRDRATQSRMEILEWIVIVLIAIEVIPALLEKYGGH